MLRSMTEYNEQNWLDLTIIYTAQNKYVCTRFFAFFDVLNWSLNIKVYIILKLVQFPIQL